MQGSEQHPPNSGTSRQVDKDSNGSQSVMAWWKGTVALLRPYVLDRLRIVDLAEPEQTMEGIERDTEFRGFSVWILALASSSRRLG